MNSSVFNGVILYDKGLDGCLNGVYTNVPANGEIWNEIVKRKDGTSSTDIAGDYHCQYFEINAINNPARQGSLNISLRLNQTNIYDFKWIIDEDIFTGVGYRMNEKQIVVNYWLE